MKGCFAGKWRFFVVVMFPIHVDFDVIFVYWNCHHICMWKLTSYSSVKIDIEQVVIVWYDCHISNKPLFATKSASKSTSSSHQNKRESLLCQYKRLYKIFCKCIFYHKLKEQNETVLISKLGHRCQVQFLTNSHKL